MSEEVGFCEALHGIEICSAELQFVDHESQGSLRTGEPRLWEIAHRRTTSLLGMSGAAPLMALGVLRRASRVAWTTTLLMEDLTLAATSKSHTRSP